MPTTKKKTTRKKPKVHVSENIKRVYIENAPGKYNSTTRIYFDIFGSEITATAQNKYGKSWSDGEYCTSLQLTKSKFNDLASMRGRKLKVVDEEGNEAKSLAYLVEDVILNAIKIEGGGTEYYVWLTETGTKQYPKVVVNIGEQEPRYGYGPSYEFKFNKSDWEKFVKEVNSD